MTSSSEQPPKEKWWNNAYAKSDSEFLAWCADRFELHYGESPNNQYIIRLREIASRPHPAPPQGMTTDELWDYSNDLAEVAARKAREDAYDKFLDEVRKEEYNNCGYVDMDSIEGVYVRLRTTTQHTKQEQPQ